MPEGARPVTIGAAQICVEADPAANLASVLAALDQAREQGVEIVCLPEYVFDPNIARGADQRAAVARVVEHCRDRGPWCVLGAERREAGRRYSAVHVIGPDGMAGCYDKVHLWRDEAHFFTPGSQSLIIDTGRCRVGVICCWDIAFPEFVADLARKGAEIIVCPSHLVDAEVDAEALRALPMARAFENAVFVVQCDAWSPRTLSESVICHPQRTLERRTTPGLIACTVDLSALPRLRAWYGWPGEREAGA